MALTKVTQSMILGGVVSVVDFGAVDDDSTNNAAAIKAAADHLQAQGGGTLVFPFVDTGIYKMTPEIASIVADFTDLDGVQVLFEGTTLKDEQTYTTGQSATAFRFTRCKNVTVEANIQSELIVTGASPTARGLIGVRLNDNCTNVDVKLTMVGGQNGVWAYRDPSDIAQGPLRQGRFNIDCTSVLYPYSGTWSGNDVIAQINATLCGRNYFIYGVQNNWLYVNSKNQQITSLIDGNGGSPTYTQGCSNIWVNWYDHNSDTTGPGAPLMEMVFRNAATTFDNIHISVDVYCPASRPFSGCFRFVKTDSTTGHVLNNFTFTGKSIMDDSVSNAHIWTTNFPQSGDIVRNIKVENFYGTGAATTFSLPVSQLSGPTCTLNNCNCATPMLAANGSNGLVTYIGCIAPYFSEATDIQSYINCVMTTPVSQVDSGKQYLNTYFGFGNPKTVVRSQDFYTQTTALVNGTVEPSTDSNYSFLYIDSADGDLKVKFGNGTVKTIQTN